MRAHARTHRQLLLHARIKQLFRSRVLNEIDKVTYEENLTRKDTVATLSLISELEGEIWSGRSVNYI